MVTSRFAVLGGDGGLCTVHVRTKESEQSDTKR